MNDLSTDIVVSTENIRNEFSLYAIVHYSNSEETTYKFTESPMRKSSHIIRNGFIKFKISNQRQIFTHDIDIVKVIDNFIDFPSKFRPKIIELRSRIYEQHGFDVFKIIFPEQIISYLEQKDFGLRSFDDLDYERIEMCKKCNKPIYKIDDTYFHKVESKCNTIKPSVIYSKDNVRYKDIPPQRSTMREIVRIFKELNQRTEGVCFDDYVKNMITKLKNDDFKNSKIFKR